MNVSLSVDPENSILSRERGNTVVKIDDREVKIPFAMWVKMISSTSLLGVAITSFLLGLWMSLMLWLERGTDTDREYWISLEAGRWFLLAGVVGLIFTIPLCRSFGKKWDRHLELDD